MIENIITHIINKDQQLVIYEIGSNDCAMSIELYKQFANSKIYVFECNPNTVERCRKNIEPYSDRISIIEHSNIDDSDDIIDICYINDHDFRFIQNKFSLRNVKLLVSPNKILYNNSSSNVENVINCIRL